jgi:hypothetical protein
MIISNQSQGGPMRFAATAILGALLPATLAAQAFCPTGRFQPDFGWRHTHCGNCAVYGSYLEYFNEPTIGAIAANGPGAGKLREGDSIVSVDGALITSDVAWHRLRDARAGDTLRFVLRREGALVQTSIVAASRCFEGESPAGRLPAISPVPVRDSAGRVTGRRFMLGDTSVEIEGPVNSVTHDPLNGDIVLRIGRTVVRVHAKR